MVATTWNPADIGSNLALSNGNLTVTKTLAGGSSGVRSTTSKSSGKWYYELTWATSSDVGFATSGYSLSTQLGSDLLSYGFEKDSGSTSGLRFNNSTAGRSVAPAVANGNTVGFALDLDNSLIYISINGAYWNGGDPVAGTGGISITADTYFAACSIVNAFACTAAFLASGFAHASPTGFSAWDAATSPFPPDDYFDYSSRRCRNVRRIPI